jgi:cytochrome d ubiquinol oxidase subunit I
VRWGRVPASSQYVLIFIAVTFTWLMGLMGYVRSGLRQHWHVYGVIRDNSPDAFTPTLGFATQVVSVTVLIFFFMIGFVFWLASLHERADHRVHAPSPAGGPGGDLALGGAVRHHTSAAAEMRGLPAEDITGRTKPS